MTRSRTVVVSLVALVVVAIAGGTLLWRQHQTAERTAASCAAVTADNAARDDSRPVASGGPVAVVLGDSYTQGQHLGRPREQAWSTLLGQQEGWTTYVDGIGLTGFTNGGYCGAQQYGTRAASALSRAPQTVVVEGGLNDTDASTADIETAARALLEDLRAVPQLVVVGPPPAPARPSAAQVDQALAAATAAAGRTYVSAIAWRLPYLPDQLHLTPAGHEQFAEQVATALVEAGVTPS